MNYLYEKVAYLKGLAEGMELKEDKKEAKLLLHIIDALEDFADAIAEVSEAQEDLDEYVEALDEDLAEVEDEVFAELDDEDYYDDEDEDYEDDFDYVEVECPHCQETVLLDDELLNDDETDVLCPSCHEVIYFSCQDDDCCCHGHGEEDKE